MNKKIRNTLIGTLVVIGAFAIPVGLQLGKVGYEDTTDNKPVDPYANIQETRTYLVEEYADVDITFAEAFLVEYNEAFTWVDEELVIDTEGTEYTYVTELDINKNYDYEYTIIDLRNEEVDTVTGNYSFDNSVILMDQEDTLTLTAPSGLAQGTITHTVQVGGTIDLTYYHGAVNEPIEYSILDVTITRQGAEVFFNHNLELVLDISDNIMNPNITLTEGWFDSEENILVSPSVLRIYDSYIIPEENN